MSNTHFSIVLDDAIADYVGVLASSVFYGPTVEETIEVLVREGIRNAIRDGLVPVVLAPLPEEPALPPPAPKETRRHRAHALDSNGFWIAGADEVASLGNIIRSGVMWAIKWEHLVVWDIQEDGLVQVHKPGHPQLVYAVEPTSLSIVPSRSDHGLHCLCADDDVVCNESDCKGMIPF